MSWPRIPMVWDSVQTQGANKHNSYHTNHKLDGYNTKDEKRKQLDNLYVHDPLCQRFCWHQGQWWIHSLQERMCRWFFWWIIWLKRKLIKLTIFFLSHTIQNYLKYGGIGFFVWFWVCWFVFLMVNSICKMISLIWKLQLRKIQYYFQVKSVKIMPARTVKASS